MKKLSLRWSPEKLGKRYDGKNIRYMSEEHERPEGIYLSTACAYLGMTRQGFSGYVNRGLVKTIWVNKKDKAVKLTDLDAFLKKVLLAQYNRRLEEKLNAAMDVEGRSLVNVR